MGQVRWIQILTFFFENNLLFVSIMYTVCAIVYLWKLKVNCVESVISFHLDMGSRDWVQVTRPTQQVLLPIETFCHLNFQKLKKKCGKCCLLQILTLYWHLSILKWQAVLSTNTIVVSDFCPYYIVVIYWFEVSRWPFLYRLLGHVSVVKFKLSLNAK